MFMRSDSYKLVVLLLFAIGLNPSTQGEAAVLAAYNFTGNSTAASSSDAHVTAGSISFGAGLTGNLPEPNNAVSRVVLTSDQLRVNVSITPNTQVLAFSGDYYFEMLLTPAAGYQLTLDTLTLGFASSWMYDPGPPVSGTPSARGFAIRTSADNFTTVVDSHSALPNPTTAFETLSMNLSGIGTVSGPLTVRIYTYDSASSISNNLRFDDLAVNGTASLVPEPRMAGLMLMGLGWAICLGRSRKRQG